MLVLGRLWTPWTPGWGSPHTSPAWMCALAFGDPLEEGGTELPRAHLCWVETGAEGESCFLGTRGAHPEG